MITSSFWKRLTTFCRTPQSSGIPWREEAQHLGGQARSYAHLVIVSDLHYPCKTVLPAKERLARMAAKEAALQGMNDWRDLDLAAFTGDMVQRSGDLSEYRLVRLVANSLKKRKAFIAGNHELLYTGSDGELRPGSCTERILHFARYTKIFGPLYYAKEKNGYLLIFLSPDTVSGGAAVEISDQQLAWLDRTLAAHRQQPTIIFCHAPLEQTAVSERPGVSLPSPRNSVQPAGRIRSILARNHQVLLWVSGHTHTTPADATFMDDANYYEDRVLNVYNSDWDEETICTNSLYLYPDYILIRTYDHTHNTWLPAFDRTIALPEWCRLTA